MKLGIVIRSNGLDTECFAVGAAMQGLYKLRREAGRVLTF